MPVEAEGPEQWETGDDHAQHGDQSKTAAVFAYLDHLDRYVEWQESLIDRRERRTSEPWMTMIVGLGGSLARSSTSRAALQRALEGAAAGAETRLLDLRELDLSMYDPDDDELGEAAAELIESCYAADGLIWSSPLYQGTISGALKNALDWLHVLGRRDPPYLHDKVIGLIRAAGGGTQGLQAINTMEFAVRALRGWAVPYVVPVASAARVFEASGAIKDESVKAQRSMLGAEVIRLAELFAQDRSVHREHECAQAAQAVAAAG